MRRSDLTAAALTMLGLFAIVFYGLLTLARHTGPPDAPPASPPPAQVIIVIRPELADSDPPTDIERLLLSPLRRTPGDHP